MGKPCGARILNSLFRGRPSTRFDRQTPNLYRELEKCKAPPATTLSRTRILKAVSKIRAFLSGLFFVLAAFGLGVNNPGFESPVLAPNTVQWQPANSQWIMTPNCGIINGSTSWEGGPHTGNQFAILFNDGAFNCSISQRFFNLEVGKLYKVRYWMARQHYSTNKIFAASVRVLVDNVEIQGGAETLRPDWAQCETPAFRATATNHLITFRTLLFPTQTATFLDDVTLDQVTDSLANLNGDFELPLIADNDYHYGCAGIGTEWYFTGHTSSGAGAGIATAGPFYRNPPASGRQCAYLQGPTMASRILRGLRVGHPYTVKFKLNHEDGTYLHYNPVDVSLDDQIVLSGVHSPVNQWTEFETPVFVPTKTSMTLKFQALSDPYADVALLDAVSVETNEFADFTIAPSGVVSGNEAVGAVQISRTAPVGGATIDLLSNSPLVKCPATVVIPEGSTTASFPITTGITAVTTTKQIQARFGLLQKTRNLIVMPAQLASVALAPASVSGGSSAVGTVTANGLAYVGFAITLTSNGPELIVPPSATIPYNKRSATFTANTLPVSSTFTRFVTASRGNRTRTATILITP